MVTEPATFHNAAQELIAEANEFAESLRIRELRRLRILDTSPEKVFHDVVSVAAAICDVPTAMIMLIDEKRAFIKATENGFPVGNFPKEQAFCTTTIKTPNQMMIVPDARLDARFQMNPLVTSNRVLFYAGMPVSSNGYALGALCLTDTQPRSFLPKQISALESIARICERLLSTTSIPDDGTFVVAVERHD